MRRHHAPRSRFLYYVLALLTLAALLPLDGSTRLRSHAPISKEEAIARAVNDIREIPEGFSLKHPRHRVEFTREGITVRSRGKGIHWRWSLSAIKAGDRALPDLGLAARGPERTSPTQIDYRRGQIVERYLAKGKSIEQQFVIPARPVLRGEKLVIEGRVSSDGELRQNEKGWQWRTRSGVAQLGNVKVFDRTGRELEARMEVTSESTRISIDSRSLETASYPVTVDPEIGANDFRISDMGPDGNTDFDAFNTSVAYNSTSNEYLVVWQGDNDTPPLVDDESEIYGQRINAATGAEVGTNDFRISDMGNDGNTAYNASSPAVAYNATNNEYLVVWQGDDSTLPLVDGEFEIFGQRLSATGAEIGTNDFRISDMGLNGDSNFGAFTPAVVWNSTDNEYFVVWEGNDDTPPLSGNEFEIFGQRLSGSSAAEIGVNDFRISDMGPDGDGAYTALNPAVAFNSINNEYLVVWEGEDDAAPLVDGEFEIFGQRINGVNGAEIGVNDFRISDMGPDGDSDYDALSPAVAYNSVNNEYLVVWVGDDDTSPLVSEEFEVWGQRINGSTGAEVGINDFRISDMGEDGDTNFSANNPSVVHNGVTNEYLVVWQGDDNTAPLGNNEFEIFAQRLTASGAEIGADDIRISDMGPDGNPLFGASVPTVVFNSTNNEYLASWQGDDNSGAFVNDEIEIFGQRIDASGAEVGTNDFRVSDMGPNGDANYAAFEPAVAYNSTNNQYLVVWSGDDNTFPLVDEEREIFGQLINASNGAEIGTNDFRISDLGPNGDSNYRALSPAVAYNSTNNEYLVVWYGDDNSSPLVNDEIEIFGQRIDGATGAEVGSNDFRISDMGTNGNTANAAMNPAVAYNPTNNEYLVVWSGDDVTDNEFEIYGQRLSGASATEVGTNDFRISDMGPDGDGAFDAANPAVAYNSTNNEYLVVWEGDDNTSPLVDGEIEIFGQRLSAATGAETGTNDFRISDMGANGNVNFGAANPALAYNSTNNEYLVVWQGDDNSGTLVDDEFEIFGQRLNAADGSELGTNDFRISDMGPDGNASYDALEPSVSYNVNVNEYLVVWQGDDNNAPQVDDEREIFYQRISGVSGAEVGVNDFRISDMGPDGNTSFNAIKPAVDYSATNREYLVVWEGRDAADDGDDIFGQRIDGDGNRPPVIAGFGTLTASVGVPFVFTVGATDPDLPLQTLAFSAVGAPAGLLIDSGTGVLTWTPTALQTGLSTFQVFVEDNGTPQNSASRFVTINVLPVRLQSALRITEVSPNAALTQVVVTARLTDNSNNGGLGFRTISFGPGNVTADTAASGLVTVALPLTGTGPHTITALFVGDSSFSGSFAKTTLSQATNGGCAYALLKTSESFAANGGTDSVLISASQGSCAWIASSNDPGIATITAGSSGIGTGTVTYAVSANSSSSAIRTGTLNLAGMTFTVVQGLNFLDVPLDNVFYTQIGKLSARQVTLGCGAGNYCPQGGVTREQMAAFIIRALGDFAPPPPASQRFSDVPPSNVFYGFIEQMAVRQITLGCGAGIYCPGNQVTREQMAAFMIRALGDFTPPVPPNQRFTDVPPANVFYGFIEQMAVRRVTLGCGTGIYCPSNGVTREQMAAFLVRAFGL
jgi:hypothetical protein